MGFIIILGGLWMDPVKIQTIKNWKILGNIKEVLFFLGLTNFYRKFIRGYLSITIFLINLIYYDILWAWDNKEQEVFDKFKKQFVPGKILIPFDAFRQIIVEMDTLDYIIGAVISQLDSEG